MTLIPSSWWSSTRSANRWARSLAPITSMKRVLWPLRRRLASSKRIPIRVASAATAIEGRGGGARAAHVRELEYEEERQGYQGERQGRLQDVTASLRSVNGHGSGRGRASTERRPTRRRGGPPWRVRRAEPTPESERLVAAESEDGQQQSEADGHACIRQHQRRAERKP